VAINDIAVFTMVLSIFYIMLDEEIDPALTDLSLEFLCSSWY